MTKVIASGSNADIAVYSATEENALEILSWYTDNIDQEVIDIQDKLDGNHMIVTQESLLKDLHEVLGIVDDNKSELVTSKEAILKQLRDALPIQKQPISLATKENRQELINYLFEKRVAIINGKIDSSKFFKNFKISDLSFLNNRYMNNCIVIAGHLLEHAVQYRAILNKEWGNMTNEMVKVIMILNFVNNWTPDYKYYIFEIKEQA